MHPLAEIRIRHQAAFEHGRQLVNPQYPNFRSYMVALFGYQIIRALL